MVALQDAPPVHPNTFEKGVWAVILVILAATITAPLAAGSTPTVGQQYDILLTGGMAVTAAVRPAVVGSYFPRGRLELGGDLGHGLEMLC